MAGIAPGGSQSDWLQVESKKSVLADGYDDSFDAVGLQGNLVKHIRELGFVKPYPIQGFGIYNFTKGKNMILESQWGSGKTTTLCLGILERLDYSVVQCQALVLTSSRAAIEHINYEMRRLAASPDLVVQACYGRTYTRDEERIVFKGVHVAVGQPGVMRDMLKRKYLRTEFIKMFVLDEADKILARGFEYEINQMRKMLSEGVQLAVFSDTELKESREFFTKLMVVEPVKLLVKHDGLIPQGVKHYVMDKQCGFTKAVNLAKFLHSVPGVPCVVFVNSQQGVDRLTKKLMDHHLPVISTPTGIDQKIRNMCLMGFTAGSYSIFITTDLPAHETGLLQVSLVINYQLPPHHTSYLNRIIRCQNWSPKDPLAVVNFVNIEDDTVFAHIKKSYNVVVQEGLPKYADFSSVIKNGMYDVVVQEGSD